MDPVELRPSLMNAAAWTAALAGHAAAMQQHWAYGAAAEALGRRVLRCEVWQGGARLGLVQMLERGPRAAPLRLILRGPVWTGPPPPARIQRATLRVLGRGATLATPEQPVAGAGLIPLITPRHIARLDLTPPPAVLRAGLWGKWRNRLVVAEAAGVTVRQEEGQPRDYRWLLAAEAAQRRVRGYRALPAGFVSVWAAAGGGLRLFTARHTPGGGPPLAAMLFLIHGDGATYQIGWTGAEGRAAKAHNLILWQALLALRAEGVRSLDLGDLNSEAAPGLVRFKLGCGAVPVALGATCLVIPSVTLSRCGRGTQSPED